MTTIACNLREMAADGKINLDPSNSVIRTRRKIVRVGGVIVGSCGGALDGSLFLEWFSAGGHGKRPKLGSDFEALVLSPGGVFHFDEECAETWIESGHHAIGSGELAARTMLSLGYSPREAVRKAIEFDNCSGPPIVVLKLKR